MIQGLALVVVPTVSTVLAEPTGLGLSESLYGGLFVPQSILAIVFSLGGATLTRRVGARTTLLLGFGANALAMGLLALSVPLAFDHRLAYIDLLCATSFLGVGFAIVTPTLNVLAGKLESRSPDRAVLIVNALLGGSAAVAPMLLIAFVGLGYWWGLPLLCLFGMLALTVFAMRIPFDVGGSPTSATAQFPMRLWVFAGFALAYGLCEQLNASWAPLYMTRHLGAPASFGSFALALFWGVATTARVAFALVSRTLRPAVVFCLLPFALAAAFVALATLPPHANPIFGVAAFALAGLGVSALLPLVLSFSEQNMPEAATSVTSVLFAIYLVGYGAAAFGVGPLQAAGIALPALDAGAVGLACIVAALAFAIVRIVGEQA